MTASNTPTGGEVLTYNSGTGGFTGSLAGSGGIGDITSIGNVTSGPAFDGTAGSGSQIIFYDAQGNGTLTFADITGGVKTVSYTHLGQVRGCGCRNRYRARERKK